MRRALVALGALALLSACFAVNDPRAHQPDPVPAEDYCASFSRILCEAAVDCCTEGTAITVPQCEAVLGPYCSRAFGPLTSDMRTGYDAEEAAIQLAIGGSLAEVCSPAFWAWFAERSGLAGGLTGSVGAGGSCAPGFDEEEAMMVDLPRFYSCREGTSCRPDPGDGTWECRALADAGEPCERFQCVEGLACVDGVCAASALPAGAICDEASDCASDYCMDSLPVDDAPRGRCLEAGAAYCAFLRGCRTEAVAYVPADSAGPLIPGGRCDGVAICAHSTDQADDIREASRGAVTCVATTADLPCYDEDGTFPQTCGAAPGVLDAQEVGVLCGITLLEPTPLVICGNR